MGNHKNKLWKEYSIFWLYYTPRTSWKAICVTSHQSILRTAQLYGYEKSAMRSVNGSGSVLVAGVLVAANAYIVTLLYKVTI